MFDKKGYTIKDIEKELQKENIKYYTIKSKEKLTKEQIKLLTEKICEDGGDQM